MATLRVRRWSLLMLAGLVFALVPSASATHDGGAPSPHRTAGPHETEPFPTPPLFDLCLGEFAGTWFYASGGLHPSGATGSGPLHDAGHNHYSLTGEVACAGDDTHTGTYTFLMGDAAFAGSGGTDGHHGNHAFDSHHGEVFDSGWSHCDGYSGGCPDDGSNANKGDVVATLNVTTGNASTSPGVNYVKFFRGGTTNLIMLGGLDWHAGPAARNAFGTIDDCFFLQAQFVPTLVDPDTGLIVTAAVAGDFQMYTPYMSGTSPCG